VDSEDSEDSDGEGQPKAKVRKVGRGDVAEAGKKKSKSKGLPTISSSTLANFYFPPADLQECASFSSSDGSSSSDNSPSPSPSEEEEGGGLVVDGGIVVVGGFVDVGGRRHLVCVPSHRYGDDRAAQDDQPDDCSGSSIPQLLRGANRERLRAAVLG
jgi:hypothetical protein